MLLRAAWDIAENGINPAVDSPLDAFVGLTTMTTMPGSCHVFPTDRARNGLLRRC